MNKYLPKIIHDNEQDQGEMESWWRESSDADKLTVWDCIQHYYSDPVMEIMSRFAQVAFGTMVEKYNGNNVDSK